MLGSRLELGSGLAQPAFATVSFVQLADDYSDDIAIAEVADNEVAAFASVHSASVVFVASSFVFAAELEQIVVDQLVVEVVFVVFVVVFVVVVVVLVVAFVVSVVVFAFVVVVVAKSAAGYFCRTAGGANARCPALAG